MDAVTDDPEIELVVGVLYKADDFLTGIGQPEESPSFAQRIDYVIIAPCALGIERRRVIRRGPWDSPPIWHWGGSAWANGKRLEFFDQMLWPRFNQTILLIPECCGPYSRQFESALRTRFPDVVWVIPRVAGGRHGRPLGGGHLLNDLNSLGLIVAP